MNGREALNVCESAYSSTNESNYLDDYHMSMLDHLPSAIDSSSVSSGGVLESLIMNTDPIPASVRVTIPSNSPPITEAVTVTPHETYFSPADNAIASSTSKEKTGRWTESEHRMFLEGLEKHGKQWKTIAGIIGTRTVVQVRTHAQKYFQKMERKQQGSVFGSGSSVESGKDTDSDRPSFPAKRKSLPGVMPSSNKKKSAKNHRHSLQLGSSGPVCDYVMNPHNNNSVPNLLEYSSASLSKSSSSSLDNWSTTSPNNVIGELVEFNTDKPLFPSLLHQIPVGEDDDDSCCPEHFIASFNFQDDPLELLDDIESHQYLPESTLQAYPDLENFSAVDEAVLNNIVDPNVTMKSLFLSEEVMDA